jgi:hypothetical protein
MTSHRRARRARCTGIAAAVTLCSSVVCAQPGTAELAGTVHDQHAAALPGVLLTIRNQDTGTIRETRTHGDGTYFVSGLAPGQYVIRASLAGLRPAERSGIRMEVGRTATIDLTLTVGPMSLSVEVTAPLLDTTSKEIGGHITSRELADLPSMNRSFIDFVALLPGIVPVGADSFGADAISVNGIDPRSNHFMLDGGNNNDDFIGQRAGTQARTPIEAISEFQVLTHQFDAQYGRATGAVIDAVTRQGTNVFHGRSFAFFQHGALAARDYFTRQNGLSRPATERQQMGGIVGGPIVRDKAHFFGSLEAVRVNRAASVNIPSRPELTTSTATAGNVWNTIARFNHQLDASHAWDVRWLREASPQKNLLVPIAGRQPSLAAAREEADVDQTTVGSLQSVLGNARVNTVRVAFTRENVAFANPGFNGNERRQDLLPPTLQYPTFIDQQSDVAQARINTAYSIEDTLAWFVAGRGGSHDVRFGVQYHFATADGTNQGMLNGLFEFRSNAPFSAADPATYPERLQIRVPGPADFSMHGHFASAYAQDKWRIGRRLTLSLGMRYDIEWIPLGEGGYPVDGNNLAPRVGFTYGVDAAGRSVVRGGYGVFYDQTPLELLSPILTAGEFSDSFIAFFPADRMDPGPSQGQLPSEPLVRNGPTVDAELIRRLFPPGIRIRNMGTVYVDGPARRVPGAHQLSIGYARQLGANVSATVDYVHASGRDMFMIRDVNPGIRADTSRTGAVTRVNPEFRTSVLEIVNTGRNDYDALELHVDKRFSNRFGVRTSYTLSYSRGNSSGNGAPQMLLQRLDQLRLDENHGPTDFDRRHNFVVSGSARVPGTGGLTISGIARAWSGLPFSIIDSRTDADRNGILFDFVPAGAYSGSGTNALTVDYTGKRNGAYGPGLFQLDARAAYTVSVGSDRSLEVLAELFNVTNSAAFDNPVTLVSGHPAADRRLTDFLEVRMLRPGAVARTGQIGVRFGF